MGAGAGRKGCWNYGSLLEWWLYYWNGDYTIEKVATLLEWWLYYWNDGYTIGMMAAHGVDNFLPNHVNIVCRLIYLFILLS